MELDTASKMFAIDNLFNITSYVDYSGKIDILDILMKSTIEKFPVLKNRIIKTDSTVFMEPVTIILSDHFNVKKESAETFNTYTKIIEQMPFQSDVKWLIYLLEDDEKQKYRLYFKINHAYADGSIIVEILNNFFSNQVTPIKMRTIPFLDTLYYLIIGTLLILYDTLKTYIEIFMRTSPIYKTETDTINVSLNLDKIKGYAKTTNVTINDMLYLLMTRTDKLYFGKRNIVFLSPVKVKGTLNNNLSLIALKTTNTNVIHDIHEIFNRLKYSLYIPMVSFIINTVGALLPLYFIKGISDYMLNNVDYVYTNVISHSELDAHFQITPRNKEIIFNFLSCSSVLNITCSFKEGVIEDKERYEKCIYAAYDEITSIPPPSEESFV